MYVIKSIETDGYFSEWSWMNNPWDARQYTKEEAEAGALFFSELNTPCVVEFIE